MLNQSVQYIKGIGPKRAEMLSRLGIKTIHDALSYFPREYEDRKVPLKIALASAGKKAIILAKVELSEQIQLGKNLSAFKACLSDGSGIIFAVFFRKSSPYYKHDIFSSLKRDFVKGKKVLVYGQVEINFGKKEINAEEYEPVADETKLGELIHFNRIVPVYPLTEGISQKWFREFMYHAVDSSRHDWPEPCPESIKKAMNFKNAKETLMSIHFPKELSDIEPARKRLAFDEFLLLETALAIVKERNNKNFKERKYPVKKSLLTPFREKLGFEFTASQKKVINEIFSDMQKTTPMNRLLMGDVGSGKTVVALSAVLLAIENGYQAVFLAPTEILAEQHFLTVNNMLKGLNINTALLTGRANRAKKEKRSIKEDLSLGRTNLIIGTHALIEEDVKFKDLGLIVIDEQHRFGVMQRAEIHIKSKNPDVLVMTATPIPRTLALTLYGDLDISVIDELPPGRQPVKTMHLKDFQSYNLVKDEIKKGHQAYIVYPLIEESDKIELKAAVKEADYLSKTVFQDYKVGLLHGQMPAGIKDKIMLDFRDKKYDILISTTVIEVGIDVANATVMVIEHAERFGLATLHQLRGRVGRGKDKSFCFLIGEPKSEDSIRRINVLVNNASGFAIAEEDLSLRGPGEFFGTMQHGLPPFKAGKIVYDAPVIEQAKDAAQKIIKEDPGLINHENLVLRIEMLSLYKDKFALSNIG
ncbi:MAG: ATP-dependent DNA helicase RecG [Elusimicrobia bacterium]|nr:ATP-dependent DNA helicase RecG [Candidatus Liberimonas magnetica]